MGPFLPPQTMITFLTIAMTLPSLNLKISDNKNKAVNLICLHYHHNRKVVLLEIGDMIMTIEVQANTGRRLHCKHPVDHLVASTGNLFSLPPLRPYTCVSQ